MVEEYKSRVFFLTIYIKEAHAADQWKLGDKIVINQHKSNEERLQATKLMIESMNFKIPTIIDTVENTFEELFAVWPERYILLEREGDNFKLNYISSPEAYGHNPITFKQHLIWKESSNNVQ